MQARFFRQYSLQGNFDASNIENFEYREWVIQDEEEEASNIKNFDVNLRLGWCASKVNSKDDKDNAMHWSSYRFLQLSRSLKISQSKPVEIAGELILAVHVPKPVEIFVKPPILVGKAGVELYQYVELESQFTLGYQSNKIEVAYQEAIAQKSKLGVSEREKKSKKKQVLSLKKPSIKDIVEIERPVDNDNLQKEKISGVSSSPISPPRNLSSSTQMMLEHNTNATVDPVHVTKTSSSGSQQIDKDPPSPFTSASPVRAVSKTKIQ
ncbi:hypothetical protein CR513_08484, partial [Mucuna pruriens]